MGDPAPAFMRNGVTFFFGYHSGHQALVFPHPETGAPVGIKVSTLRERGFHVTEEDLLRVLPRFTGDEEKSLTPRATMADVEAFARAKRQARAQIRARR
jgi:hypothetical protein